MGMRSPGARGRSGRKPPAFRGQRWRRIPCGRGQGAPRKAALLEDDGCGRGGGHVPLWLLWSFEIFILRFASHILDIENLMHIFETNLGQVHYCHSILIFPYATSSKFYPLAKKRRDVKWPVLKLRYLFYNTIIRVLVIIVVHGVYTDTTILVCGFSIFVSCVKYNQLYRKLGI
jgi:hypothetical protein